MPVLSKHSRYQKNPFSMVTVCGWSKTRFWQRFLGFFLNYRRFGGWRGWLSFFPVNCGLSVLENIIDVEGVSIPVSCVYTDLWDMYTQTWGCRIGKKMCRFDAGSFTSGTQHFIYNMLELLHRPMYCSYFSVWTSELVSIRGRQKAVYILDQYLKINPYENLYV